MRRVLVLTACTAVGAFVLGRLSDLYGWNETTFYIVTGMWLTIVILLHAVLEIRDEVPDDRLRRPPSRGVRRYLTLSAIALCSAYVIGTAAYGVGWSDPATYVVLAAIITVIILGARRPEAHRIRRGV